MTLDMGLDMVVVRLSHAFFSQASFKPGVAPEVTLDATPDRSSRTFVTMVFMHLRHRTSHQSSH